jgi:hypothetical protein
MLMLLLLYLQVILGGIALVFLTLNFFKGGKNKQFITLSRGFLIAAAVTIVLRMFVMFNA